MTKHKVVLVPFPFDDLSSNKVCPAVCLTDPIGPHDHIILAFITSRIPASPLKTDLVIEAILRTGRFFTFQLARNSRKHRANGRI